MNKKRDFHLLVGVLVSAAIILLVWGLSNYKLLDPLLPYIKLHGKLISFLGGFITGESVIISLAFLSANGLLPLWQVLIFCTLGMYASDFVPFLIGRTKFFVRLLHRKKLSAREKRIEDRLLHYAHNNFFLALLYTKFIYGASIPALIYFGSRKKSYKYFILYNLLVELIFVPIVVLIGWLSGKGFGLATTFYKDFKIVLLLIIIFVVILFFITRWINEKLGHLMEKEEST